jgi:probable rRNA maturation factor
MFSVINKTRVKIPRIPFEDISNRVLGKNYELSLVFCSDTLSRRLNRTYRHKDYPTNILSFPISETSGEIFINVRHLKGFSIQYLFIHGLLHLKGFEHGDKMDTREKSLLKAFGF